MKNTPFLMNAKVAIQGVKGSYHEQAAINYFGEAIEVVDCQTFPAFFEAMGNYDLDYGVMAIENTVAGTILSNYNLLKQSPLTIIGEVYVRIEHQLMALPGQTLQDISQVKSHNMAILQCTNFFAGKKWIELMDASDTALIARQIAQQKTKGLGAIASKRAAEINGLTILAQNIENNPRNFTRFFVLQKITNGKELPFKDNNKISFGFHLDHRPGSLAQVLSTFSYYRLNLTKIQSMPLVGREWEYYFHIDVEYDEVQVIKDCIAAIQHYISDLNYLGIYKRGKKH